MKFVLVFLIGVVVGMAGMWTGLKLTEPKLQKSLVLEVREKPLLKYTIENLSKRVYKSEIKLDDRVSDGVYKFHFDSDGKNVTGLAHLPTGRQVCQKCPVIVQIRGYAEQDNYEPGYGTNPTAEKFAEAGFITLAPDFLGYGGSASPAADVFEARFETYTTTLNLLAAADKWSYSNGKIAIWGHSNGGQIALTALEISGNKYLPAGRQVPTVLWAPVSTGFPYSILYYMNDNEEGDKLLRKELVNFEEDYDTGQFNLLNFLDHINVPIQLEQGTGDLSVPVIWSRDLVDKLKGLKKDIVYDEYPGADHNLVPVWNTAVERAISFYKEKLGVDGQ